MYNLFFGIKVYQIEGDMAFLNIIQFSNHQYNDRHPQILHPRQQLYQVTLRNL